MKQLNEMLEGGMKAVTNEIANTPPKKQKQPLRIVE